MIVRVVLFAVLGLLIGVGSAMFIVDPTWSSILSGPAEYRFLVFLMGLFFSFIGGFLGHLYHEYCIGKKGSC